MNHSILIANSYFIIQPKELIYTFYIFYYILLIVCVFSYVELWIYIYSRQLSVELINRIIKSYILILIIRWAKVVNCERKLDIELRLMVDLRFFINRSKIWLHSGQLILRNKKSITEIKYSTWVLQHMQHWKLLSSIVFTTLVVVKK